VPRNSQNQVPGVTRVVGGEVVLPDASVADLDIEIVDGRIVGVAARGSLPSPDDMTHVTTLDAGGRLVAPGLIDIQINGGWGHDFTHDPDGIAIVARHLPSTGVTAFVPTIVTSPLDRRRAAIDAIRATGPTPASGAAVLGLHFEGPAIAAARRGAHDPRYIGVPADDEIETWTAENGVVMATVAPELDGAAELVARLVDQGVVVAIGHTACTVDEFERARAAGATVVTHLFNAMARFEHRSPGPIGATLADPTVRAGLICDGIHVDPTAIRMAWRTLGADRTILVTDAVAALGLDVMVGSDGVRTAAGVLAGSALPLDAAVRNLVAFAGCTPAEALCAASTTPAAALGLADRGRIEPGAVADLVLFDDDLHPARTIIGGTVE